MNMKELPSIESAPELSYKNRDAILAYNDISCYSCINHMLTEYITDWTDYGQTPLCPYCDMDTVVPGLIPKEWLIAACERWLCKIVDQEPDDNRL